MNTFQTCFFSYEHFFFNLLQIFCEYRFRVVADLMNVFHTRIHCKTLHHQTHPLTILYLRKHIYYGV
jgi:hypothetical protein